MWLRLGSVVLLRSLIEVSLKPELAADSLKKCSFLVFDASGKPIKRSGMDAFGHFGPTADDELLSKLEPPHLSHEYHEVPVVFDEHQADARNPYTSSDLNLEVPATALVSDFGPSGNYPRPGLTS